MLESPAVIQCLVVATYPPQAGKRLGNLNRDRLLTSRLLKYESKGQCKKNTAYHPSSSGAIRNRSARLNSHATKIKLQPTIRPRLGSCTPKVQTTSSQLFILAIRFRFWVREPTLNWPLVAKRIPVRFLGKGGRREEGAASHRPGARRAPNLLLGRKRGRTPAPHVYL